eukprot:CAMPEP_0196573906 /NCGR_PEP_ID=MMETSP1081-20130531/3725_1 /TAXON_ID=36882 /ORGANISM="Pyramimonas amylifera, Strain CCMP720" /LENGTH=200 /DNA_ID=CAMNT_0041891759 /DNA_START=15 /DNA_END=614 /DNA_ORIENTATION=+
MKRDNSCLSSIVNEIVSPGDAVFGIPSESDVVLRLGGGLHRLGETVSATRTGALRYSHPGKYWVEGSQRRYLPQIDDPIVGLITNRHGENFEVDIGAAFKAILSATAFEGASRRNRPLLKVGALVYGRVTAADRDLDPEIECTDADGKSSGFGPLTGGYMFQSSTGLARVLLSNPPCPILSVLGQELSYELAVGLNGRVW